MDGRLVTSEKRNLKLKGTYLSFFPKALRRVLPENPLNTDTLPLTRRHSHLHTHTGRAKASKCEVLRSMPVSKYASVSMQACNDYAQACNE